MITSNLFEYFIQWMSASAGLILIGGIIAHAIFRKSPVWRHHIWLCVLVAVLMVPVLTWIQPILSMGNGITWNQFVSKPFKQNTRQIANPNIEEKQESIAISASFTSQTDNTISVRKPIDTSESDPAIPLSNARWIPRPEIQAMVLWVWGAGTFCLALRWAVGTRRLKGIVKQSTRIEEKIVWVVLHRVADALEMRYIPDLRQSLDIHTPMVIGSSRPRILLPDTQSFEETELQQILEHECAHIKRLDPWVWMLQRIGRLIFWINPLFHWMHTELNRAREELCDNHVLKTWNGVEYAKTLARVSKLWTTPSIMQDGLAIGFRKHQLVGRVESILDESVDHRMVLRPNVRILSGTFIVLWTLISITLASELSVEAPNETSPQGENPIRQVLESSQHTVSKTLKLYPTDLGPYIHHHISGEALEVYPWVKESDYHRISRDFFEWPPMHIISISPRGTNGFLISKEFAKAFGLSIGQVKKVNQALANDFHELKLLEFSGLVKEKENYPPNIQPGGLVKKILEAHTFVRSDSDDKEKANEIRAKTKRNIDKIIGKERSSIFWQGGLPFNIPLFNKYFTFRLEDLGTQLEVGLHRARDGGMNGRPFPHEWDHYAPETMQPVLARWRDLARESLDDDDEPVLIFPDEEPEDYSELTDSGVYWTDNASFLDLPKTMISTLGISGLDILRQVSLEGIALAGLTEGEVNFVMTQYGVFESQFQALEKSHFHAIEHPEYNYQLDAFPEEAKKLKGQWQRVLIEEFGDYRGKIIDGLIRTRPSFIQQEKMRMKALKQNPSNESLWRMPKIHYIWLNEGAKTIQLKFTNHGNDRGELKYEDSNGVPGSFNGPMDLLPQPFRHLLYPKVAAPPKGAF